MQDVAGKVAFITGGASGIGLGMARAFAKAGVQVAIADIEDGPAEEARAEIAGLGVKTATYHVDVSDRASVQAAADAAEREFGKIHILCSNAGVGGGGPLDQVPGGQWDWVLGVNLGGAVNCLLAFLPKLKAHGEGGHVVFTSSMSGLRVFEPSRGQGVYNTTKFGLVGMGTALALDMATYNVGVTVLCPGMVKSQIWRSGRNRPAEFGGPYENKPTGMLGLGATETGLEPEVVGGQVLDAIRDNELFCVTDTTERHLVEAHHAKIMRAFDVRAEWENR